MKDQFRNKLIDRRTERVKQIFETNKKNRAKQKAHHPGAKRFAKRIYESIKKGLSVDDARIKSLKLAYPNDEDMNKVVDWVETQSQNFTDENSQMPKSDLIEISLREHFGKNKRNRKLGLGEAASLSSNTSHRLEGKGKYVQADDEDGSRNDDRAHEPPPDTRDLWERYRMMERALLANGIDISAYSSLDPGASTSGRTQTTDPPPPPSSPPPSPPPSNPYPSPPPSNPSPPPKNNMLNKLRCRKK